MQKRLLAAALGAALLATSAAVFAEEEASPHTLTANVGLFSQYIFRGLTQTDRKVALQGGFDYSHASGLYAGVWGSNVSWLRDADFYRSGGSAEIDVYAGFKSTFMEDFTYDVGVLQYLYPGSPVAGSADGDTTEVYGAVGWKWITLKYSYAVSDDVFGTKDARGTDYWDLSAAYPLGETGVTLGAHYGVQKFDGAHGANDDALSYNDWRLSVAYDLSKISAKMAGSEVGLMYTDTGGASKVGYGSRSQGGVYPRNIADGTATVWFKKTF